MRQILSKKFLKYFLISFLIFEVVLLLNYISRYFEDIFGKGIPASNILELIFYSSVTLIGFSLLFGILLATIFSFRYFSSRESFSFKSNILSGLVIMLFISLLHFSFNNWILPKANVELYSLVYEFKSTAPNSEFKRVDRSLFKQNKIAMSIKELNLHIDTVNTEIEEYIQKSDSLIAFLPDTVATEIYNSSRLESYGVKYKSSTQDTLSEREINRAGNYLKSFGSKLQRSFKEKQDFKKEKFTKIILPLELILLFLIGASFGFYYNDQKAFLLVILGLYTTSFFSGTIIGIEKMIANNIFGNTAGTIYSILVLVAVTTIFIVKSLRKEKN